MALGRKGWPFGKAAVFLGEELADQSNWIKRQLRKPFLSSSLVHVYYHPPLSALRLTFIVPLFRQLLIQILDIHHSSTLIPLLRLTHLSW